MKLLLDENLSHRHAIILRSQGYDAIAITEAGLSGTSDEKVRAFAIESGRVLITLDADFANILRFPPAGTPGVIRLKIHPPTEEAIRDQIQRTLHVLKDTSLVVCVRSIDAYIERQWGSQSWLQPAFSRRSAMRTLAHHEQRAA